MHLLRVLKKIYVYTSSDRFTVHHSTNQKFVFAFIAFEIIWFFFFIDVIFSCLIFIGNITKGKMWRFWILFIKIYGTYLLVLLLVFSLFLESICYHKLTYCYSLYSLSFSINYNQTKIHYFILLICLFVECWELIIKAQEWDENYMNNNYLTISHSIVHVSLNILIFPWRYINFSYLYSSMNNSEMCILFIELYTVIFSLNLIIFKVLIISRIKLFYSLSLITSINSISLFIWLNINYFIFIFISLHRTHVRGTNEDIQTNKRKN